METKVVALAVVKIASMPLFMPPYLLLIWIFATKPEFRKFVAYKLIVTVGFMDCFYLLQSLVAGILTFTWTDELAECVRYDRFGIIHPEFNCGLMVLGQVFSTMRNGYMLAVPFLSMVMAFNRLVVMLHLKNKEKADIFCMCCIVLGWFIFYPLMAILHYGIDTLIAEQSMTMKQMNIQFDFEKDGYVYAGTESFKKFMGNFGPAMEAGAFAFTLAVVVVIILQKNMHGSNYRISPMEIRLIIQGFLITLPLAFLQVCGLRFAQELGTILWFHVLWHLVGVLIPAINLTVCVVFNPPARRHLIRTLQRFRSNKKIQVVTVATVMPKIKA